MNLFFIQKAEIKHFKENLYCFQVVCIGSIAELEELSGVKIDDLHREKYDKNI